MSIVGITDIGKKRQINEDNYFIYDDGFFIYGFVADGMGGHTNGDVASKMAVDIIRDNIRENVRKDMDYVELGEAVRQAFLEANYRMYEYAGENGLVCNMGCTATFATIYQGKIVTVHVGDSRVYKIGDDIVQLTKDHTYVQELVSRGDITKEEAENHPRKNYITRAMGTEEFVKADVRIGSYNGETILICSDGLTNMISESDILKIISENTDLEKTANILIDKANENGGKDNITVLLLKK